MWAVVLIQLCLHAVLAMDANEGQVYIGSSGTTITSTSQSRNILNTVDGDENTVWRSRGCMPLLYWANKVTNVLTDACLEPESCSAENLNETSSHDLNRITDGLSWTTLDLETDPNGSGNTLIDITVPKPQRFQVVSIYAIYGNGTTYLRLYSESTMVHEFAFTVADNWANLPMEVPVDDIITRMTLEFEEKLHIKDLSAIGEEGCVEVLTYDFGEERDVAGLKSMHHTDGAGLQTQVFFSLDNSTWTLAADFDPESLEYSTAEFPPITTRFIKLVHKRTMDWHTYWYVHEVDAFGADGYSLLRDHPGGIARGPTPTLYH